MGFFDEFIQTVSEFKSEVDAVKTELVGTAKGFADEAISMKDEVTGTFQAAADETKSLTQAVANDFTTTLNGATPAADITPISVRLDDEIDTPPANPV